MNIFIQSFKSFHILQQCGFKSKTIAFVFQCPTTNPFLHNSNESELIGGGEFKKWLGGTHFVGHLTHPNPHDLTWKDLPQKIHQCSGTVAERTLNNKGKNYFIISDIVESFFEQVFLAVIPASAQRVQLQGLLSWIHLTWIWRILMHFITA